jgi:hypothetical protein
MGQEVLGKIMSHKEIPAFDKMGGEVTKTKVGRDHYGKIGRKCAKARDVGTRTTTA